MAKLKLETSKLKNMVSRVTKCNASSGLNTISNYIELKVSRGVFSLRTSDSFNTFIAREHLSVEEDFEAVIVAKEFVGVVLNSSTKETTLDVSDSAVQMTSNGRYIFPRSVEDAGEPMTLAPINRLDNPDFRLELKLNDLRDLIRKDSKFIGSAFDDPRLDSYYFGDKVLVTNGSIVCFNNKKFFPEPLMLKSSTVSLLQQFVGDDNSTVVVEKKGMHIQIYNDTSVLDTAIHPNSGEYPVELLSKYLKGDYSSSITVNVAALKETLSRIVLFVDLVTQQGACIFNVEADGIHISSYNGRATEVVKFTNPINFGPCNCYLSVPMVQRIIDMPGADEVSICYEASNPNLEAVKADFGEDIRILGTMDESDFNSDVSNANVGANSAAVSNFMDESEPSDGNFDAFNTSAAAFSSEHSDNYSMNPTSEYEGAASHPW